jgi:hypothetical protein
MILMTGVDNVAVETLSPYVPILNFDNGTFNASVFLNYK